MLIATHGTECQQVVLKTWPADVVFCFDGGVEVEVRNFYDLSTPEGKDRLVAVCHQLGFGTKEEVWEFVWYLTQYKPGVLLARKPAEDSCRQARVAT
jgi:uncharacterized Fe-S cluster-containing protein